MLHQCVLQNIFLKRPKWQWKKSKMKKNTMPDLSSGSLPTWKLKIIYFELWCQIWTVLKKSAYSIKLLGSKLNLLIYFFSLATCPLFEKGMALIIFQVQFSTIIFNKEPSVKMGNGEKKIDRIRGNRNRKKHYIAKKLVERSFKITVG